MWIYLTYYEWRIPIFCIISFGIFDSIIWLTIDFELDIKQKISYIRCIIPIVKDGNNY